MVNLKGTEYRKKENLKRFFYPKEWLDFYNRVPDNLKFFYQFLLQTGVRYHELSKVTVEDLDDERNFITIKYPKNRIGRIKKVKIICTNCNNFSYLTKNTKFCPYCGKEYSNIEQQIDAYSKQVINRRKEIRNVKISNKFKDELKEYIKKNKLNKKDTFNIVSIQYLNQTMKKILKEMNVKDWRDFSIHNLRKTHENYIIALGSNPLAIKMHMGHAVDVASTYYISTNIFTQEELIMIGIIMDNLKI